MRRKIWTSAVRDTLPVLAGYTVLGMGFGILMRSVGYSAVFAVAMSVFIFAGSMQYAAVGLLTGGASLLTVGLTTLAVNARHLFYGLSMVEKYRDTGKVRPYLIFGLTDETYSLVCQGGRETEYYFSVTLLDHFYWVAGTLAGAVLGSFLRFDTTGIDFAMTALFLTVFTDQWLKRKDHLPALTGVGSSVLCLLLFGSERFLIPAMALIAVILLARMRKEVRP